MKKKIRSIEIEPAENGGHTVTHRHKDMPSHSSKNGMGSMYVEPETHVFGAGQGHEMLAHVANALSIDEGDIGGEKAERDAEEDEVEA